MVTQNAFASLVERSRHVGLRIHADAAGTGDFAPPEIVVVLFVAVGIHVVFVDAVLRDVIAAPAQVVSCDDLTRLSRIDPRQTANPGFALLCSDIALLVEFRHALVAHARIEIFRRV